MPKEKKKWGGIREVDEWPGPSRRRPAEGPLKCGERLYHPPVKLGKKIV